MRFGIEIETIGLSPARCAEVLRAANINAQAEGYNHRTQSHWKCTTDASIGRNNCEIVSPPMDVDSTTSMLQVGIVLQALRNAGARVDRRCGIHVHIEVRDESKATIANVFNRYKRFESEIDRMMPPSRRGARNGYCRSLAGFRDMAPNLLSTQVANYCGTRYVKVNLKSYIKYGTIEFRQHSGSLNTEKVVNWICFCRDFVKASRPTHPSVPTVQTPRLKGKKLAIYNLLKREALKPEQIAELTQSTKKSVQSMVCHMRKAGIQIIRRPRSGEYELVDQSASQTILADSVFRGMTGTLVEAMRQRMAQLA